MDANQDLPQAIVDEFVGNAHGNFARVKELLEQYPALVNAKAAWGETAIEAAAQTGSRPIMELLLAAGAPMDICTAAVMGLKDEVAEMLTADPAQAQATGAHGIPVLHFPCIGGHRDIAELLLAHGAEVNAGEGSNTPLHGTAMFGQLEMTRWLLDHGANVNAPDYEGKTPLFRAQQNGHMAVADLLRERGGEES